MGHVCINIIIVCRTLILCILMNSPWVSYDSLSVMPIYILCTQACIKIAICTQSCISKLSNWEMTLTHNPTNKLYIHTLDCFLLPTAFSSSFARLTLILVMQENVGFAVFFSYVSFHIHTPDHRHQMNHSV